MRYELFVADRYLRSKKRTGFISLITWISVAGVALGVAVNIDYQQVSFSRGMRVEMGPVTMLLIASRRQPRATRLARWWRARFPATRFRSAPESIRKFFHWPRI